MTKDTIGMILAFAAAVIALALSTLPVTPELVPWLKFAILVINAALTIFFGSNVVKALLAKRAAKK